MDPTERFSELMLQPEDQVRLDEASLCIAAHARPGLAIDAELRRWDDLAAGCARSTVEGVVAHVWGELGFRGDDTTYDDPRNSYMDQVMDRRRGIPISLGVLAMEIGRRLDVTLLGVGMPGHFLLRPATPPTVFVDPFTGALMDVAACEELFHRRMGPTPFDLRWLLPVGPFAICARMLANLKVVARATDDRDAMIWVTRLRCLVPGTPPAERAELARLLA